MPEERNQTKCTLDCCRTNQMRAPVNPVHEERTDKERAQRLDRRHEEQKSDDLCVFATGLSMRDDLN